jgi:hypothetical protein
MAASSTTDPVETVDDAAKVIDGTAGYPVAIKAAGGEGASAWPSPMANWRRVRGRVVPATRR